MVNFGHKLKLLRTSKKLTQSQLAKRIGVTKSMISAYETSMRLPSLEILVKIACELKVTTDYLLGIDKRNDLEIPHYLTATQKVALINFIETLKQED